MNLPVDIPYSIRDHLILKVHYVSSLRLSCNPVTLDRRHLHWFSGAINVKIKWWSTRLHHCISPCWAIWDQHCRVSWMTAQTSSLVPYYHAVPHHYGVPCPNWIPHQHAVPHRRNQEQRQGARARARATGDRGQSGVHKIFTQRVDFFSLQQ